MTYVEVINAVLRRLRESTVSSPSQTTYSALVGEFVNDAKRVVEDAWQWTSQTYNAPLTTTASTSVRTIGSYASILNERAKPWINPSTGEWVARCNTEGYYDQIITQIDAHTDFGPRLDYGQGFPNKLWLQNDGTTTSGQSPLRLVSLLYPDGAYSIEIMFHNPQNALTASDTVITAPTDPIIQLAYLYCLYERGEELGEILTMTEGKAKNALADAIAIDSVKFRQDLVFYAK